MRRTLIAPAALLALAGLASACKETPKKPSSGEATPPKEAAGNAKTVTIGFTASLTGKSNVESTRQKNGLQLWMDQVNAKGGLTLSDGSKVRFKAHSYDDESNKERVQELYARLINDDKAEFLISPYGSGPTDAAAVLAEQYGKIMITAGAASDDTYKKGYKLVYQTYTPASRYLTGALDLLATLDPNAKKIAIVHENDKFSSDVVNALKGYAEKKGFQVALFEGYDTSTTDFGPILNKVSGATPDAIVGGGHFQDGNTLAKQLAEKKVAVKFLALLVAPPEPKFADLGDAAVGVIGPSQWEPQAAYTAEAGTKVGAEWYGPTGAEFVTAYKSAFGGEEPSYHAAGGYMAGSILQRAIEKAGSLDTEAVRAALDKMDAMTFYGRVKFDTGEAHGLQVGHEMVYIQWQKGSDGKLVKQLVWPAEGATAKTQYPIR